MSCILITNHTKSRDTTALRLYGHCYSLKSGMRLHTINMKYLKHDIGIVL